MEDVERIGLLVCCSGVCLHLEITMYLSWQLRAKANELNPKPICYAAMPHWCLTCSDRDVGAGDPKGSSCLIHAVGATQKLQYFVPLEGVAYLIFSDILKIFPYM